MQTQAGRENAFRRLAKSKFRSRFHLSAIDNGAFEIASLDELEGYDSIMGLAFENLVVNNYRLLLPLLHGRWVF